MLHGSLAREEPASCLVERHVIEGGLVRAHCDRILLDSLQITHVSGFAYILHGLFSLLFYRWEFCLNLVQCPPSYEQLLSVGKMKNDIATFTAALWVKFNPANFRIVYGETIDAELFETFLFQATTLTMSLDSSKGLN